MPVAAVLRSVAGGMLCRAGAFQHSASEWDRDRFQIQTRCQEISTNFFSNLLAVPGLYCGIRIFFSCGI